MSDNEAPLVPYTDILRQECPRLRILVIGKSGAGKSALINAVFGVDATPVSHKTPGVHDINKPLSFPSNDRIIVHDSKGFESGKEDQVQDVLDFIDRRSNMPALADRLHAIWVCAEIPFSGSRLFETGVERLLTECQDSVPIIVVFTKLDILRLRVEGKVEKQLEERGEDLDDDEFEKIIDAKMDEAVHSLCVQPFCALTASDSPKYPWVATSNVREPRFEESITKLVDCALNLTKLENVWIEMAIAQRSNAKASIDASIRIGRKLYWRGLLSDIFVGLSMRKVLDLLHKDIINVWNMEDPNGHLQKPEFLALLSVLVEDLSDQEINNYPLTERAIHAIIENPTSIVVTGPTAVIVLFAEWVRGTYKKTKNSLRCMVAFIIDLTLTMDTLFYLVLSRGMGPMTVRLVNKALLMYKARKAPVHASIRAWADHWGTFSHMDSNMVINKVQELLQEYSVKPEQWMMKDEIADKTWIAVDALRDSEI
ncbi:hypothetical protein M422DRAFT_270584 [Sphaerobolus stellatus SS14]|uniref:G domain-containing protein n=1 Tax=Sphaerobolus stellatus (strain SS14) TaxID=990650 RepID=A0A0C9USI1_SPHS4|nr:hypothetical protein M422DRAFT_270584 [Sphaerobolus stellatus SS14]